MPLRSLEPAPRARPRNPSVACAELIHRRRGAAPRKEDLNYEEWPPTYRSIERRQKKQLRKIWNDWASRIKKSKLNEEEFFIFKTVIVDIPIHICKPYIGKKFPSYIFKFIEETFQHQISNLKLNQ